VTDVFGAASHDEVLQLVLQIALLLGAARGLGGIAQRLKQPAVVGEILAGVILGPSLLSTLIPFLGTWVLPQTEVQGHLLEVVGLIGVMLLLVVTGLETDLGLIRRRAGVAIGVSMGALILPFASGLALGAYLPDDLLTNPAQRTVFALFLATSMAISAIPVLAKVLMDMGLMRREFGQTILAAGMIDDITGWTLLGLVTALAGAQVLTVGTVATTIGMVAFFLVATVTVGRWMVDKGLELVQDRFRGRDSILTLIVVLAFGWGAFSQALHLEPVIGAFAIGILFGRLPRLPASVVHKLEAMALAVFAPIFFAIAGLKVDVVSILQPRLLLITLVVIGIATFGKVVGAYIGGRYLARQDHWTSLAYGAGLNARGALEIIVASIGLSLGILTQEMFSIIVVMAVATSLMAPVALRWTLGKVSLGAEEARRLDREAAMDDSFAGTIRRVLVPVRPRHELSSTQTIAATVIDHLHDNRGIDTTVLAVAREDRRVAEEYLLRFSNLFVHQPTIRVVHAVDPTAAILNETKADYDLMVLGAPAVNPSDTVVFGRLIDDLIKLSTCPTLVIRGGDTDPDWDPTHILVPTNGTAATRRATDLAFAIAPVGSRVTGLHVINPTRLGIRGTLASDVTAEIAAIGSKLDLETGTEIREAESVEAGILSAIDDLGADLLVLGTNVRAGSTRLHLGPRVEYLVRHAPCPVLILNT